MSDELVARLRSHVRGDYEKTAEFLLGLAADEIERLEDKVEFITFAGEDLAEALLAAQCDCPNYSACECEKQRSLDAWVKATRDG